MRRDVPTRPGGVENAAELAMADIATTPARNDRENMI
jgi:hypothetical protein